MSLLAKEKGDMIEDFIYDTPQIDAVSFSRMSVHEQCPYRSLLTFGPKRIAEPPPPPGVEPPWARGSRIHEAAEYYIRSVRNDLIPELRDFATEFEALRERFAKNDGTISVEDMWCFDKEWKTVKQNDYDNIWMRVKQDAVVLPIPERVVCIDFKTGKKVGNEVKHNLQLRIATLGAYHKYPKAEEFVLENWYTDHDIHVQQRYTRREVEAFSHELDERLRAVTSCTDFTPNPSKENCKYCHLKSGKVGRYVKGTGDCQYAYPG